MSNVRVFTVASSEYLTLSAPTFSGYGSLLAIVKSNELADDYHSIISANAAGTARLNFTVWLGTNLITYSTNDSADSSVAGMSLQNVDGWAIVGGTKATGTVAPRFHRCILSGPTWTHNNGTTNDADSGAVTAWQIGRQVTYGNYWAGSIYLCAWWDAQVLGDADYEAFTSLSAIVARAPTHLWLLNQASVAIPVTDYMGHGANQSAIVGTSVTSDTIPNFVSDLYSRVNDQSNATYITSGTP
jgi:hypothetical protein